MPSHKEKAIVKKNCINALNLMLLLKIVKNSKIRRWWVKPHLSHEIRVKYGAYHTVFMYFKLNDHEEFMEFMHMNVDQFTTLYQLVERNLRKETTKFRIPLNPELRLAFFIWFLAHGGDVNQAVLKFHIGTSTAYELIKEVCIKLHNILRPLYVPMPTENEWRRIANDYEELWNFPNCVGALDGKHIDIEKPPLGGSCFWSYKKKHTFVLMAIADAHKRFIWYSLGDFGSLNDASIFSNTDFALQLANNQLGIPPPKELPNTHIKVPFILVADEIFKLTKYIMKSYGKAVDLPVPESVFNYRLKRARLCIECAFGMLAEKFHVLQQKLKFDLMTSRFMVSAMVCLHNYLITTNADLNLDNRNDVPAPNLENQQNQHLQMTPIQQRQLLTAYFCSTAGTVEWQYRYI